MCEFVGGSGCTRDNVLAPGSINNLHKPAGKFTCNAAEVAVVARYSSRTRKWITSYGRPIYAAITRL